jgi:hypothetical protein
MSKTRYLTKSRFKLGRQCSTKLYYTGKRDVYADNGFDDPFLNQLAIGGFQVGELARHFYPGGEHVLTQNYGTAIEVTDELLKREKVTIYEAAFQYGHFFIRTDILIKNGNAIDLIEVKAKSCDFEDDNGFLSKPSKTKAQYILKDWRESIEDVAFQKHVLQLASPEYQVWSYLMLVDKTVVAPTDGLNQKFRAAHDSTGTRCVEVRGELTADGLSVDLLRVINVDRCCEMIYADDYETLSFDAHVEYLADTYAKDRKSDPTPGSVCKKCEFRLNKGSDQMLQCGYRECWTDAFKWGDEDFNEPNILDVWNLDSRKYSTLIAANKIKFSQLTEEDVSPKSSNSPHEVERRWRQIAMWQKGDTAPYIDRSSLEAEFEKWKYPLHFIDFETCSPAIPYKAGRRPYEGIAFQFSHHIVEKDGTVHHAGQFIDTTPGAFPNYDFVRELKRQLDIDDGSIFRYHNHENSYLCLIREQLLTDPSDIFDRDELVSFIESVAKPRNLKDHPGDNWLVPERCMIDLYDLVVRYYFDPAMRGSNSIKQVLPATLNNSEYLKATYRDPIYGGGARIPSLNFTEPHVWVEFDDRGKVIDPYYSLRGVFDGVEWTEHDYSVLIGGIDDISDGGAAMAAYGKLQYEEMTELERGRLSTALLKYCELDTFAMVMIFEAWKAELI